MESVRSGNIFGSLEATILESRLPGVDSTQAMLYVIHEYLHDEKPYFANAAREFDLDHLDALLHPDNDDSTDLGDVPQADRKGAMDMRVRPYGYMYNYSLIREDEKKD